MPTSVATAYASVVTAALADSILLELTGAHPGAAFDKLTDDNAADVWSVVAGRLQVFRSGMYGRRTDVGLADLNARLQRIIADVRKADERSDIEDLVDRYRGIRDAQRALTLAAAGRSGEVEFQDIPLRVPVGQLLQIAGVVSNIDEVWPDWRNRMRGSASLMPPWEHDSNRPFDITPSATNLRWLVSSDAQPWVPTLAEAGQAVSRQFRVEEERLQGGPSRVAMTSVVIK
jgi:hypothetical protein